MYSLSKNNKHVESAPPELATAIFKNLALFDAIDGPARTQSFRPMRRGQRANFLHHARELFYRDRGNCRDTHSRLRRALRLVQV